MGANSLKNVVIVLVEPQGPLNVGATARAMKNMGLSRLAIVGDMDLTSDECRLFASASLDILDQAKQFKTLDDALASSTFVVGTTARGRHRIETSTPRIMSREILDHAFAGETALLFGREDFGLDKVALHRCHRVISIPTSAERASLNLAQAILIVCYELFLASETEPTTAGTDVGNILDGEQWSRLYHEMLTSCAETGYMSEGTKVAIEQSLLRLLTLGPIQTRDARHLFGLVRRMAKVIDGRVEPRPEQTFYERSEPPREGDG